MKQQLNEVKRMQELAGIIIEAELNKDTLHESIPLELRLAYQKWIESEKPDYFGGDRDQELRLKNFLKILDSYNYSVRGKLLNDLEKKYGEIPERFRHWFRKLYKS